MPTTTRILAWLHAPIPFIALGMLLSCATVLGLTLPYALCSAAMSGAWIVYLLDRGLRCSPEDRRNHEERADWYQRVRFLPPGLAGLSLIVLGWSLLSVDPDTRLRLVFYIPLGASYVLPLLPGRRRIKDVPFLKTPVILLGWCGVCLLIPEGEKHASILLWILYRCLYLLPNLLCADWIDREGDRKEGLRTLAQCLSRTQLRRVCSISLLLAMLIALYTKNTAWILDGVGCLFFLLQLWLQPSIQKSAKIADLFLLWPLIATGLSAVSQL